MGRIFHGANVDGGTYPAQIWGQYMKAAARGFCGKFKKPKQPFKPRAFKPKNAAPVPVPITPVAPQYSPEQLAEQARRAQEQVQRQRGQIRPAPGGIPESNTGGDGYNPDTYNPDAYDDPPRGNNGNGNGNGEGNATPP